MKWPFRRVLMNSTMWSSAPTSRQAIHFTFNNPFRPVVEYPAPRRVPDEELKTYKARS